MRTLANYLHMGYDSPGRAVRTMTTIGSKKLSLTGTRDQKGLIPVLSNGGKLAQRLKLSNTENYIKFSPSECIYLDRKEEQMFL